MKARTAKLTVWLAAVVLIGGCVAKTQAEQVDVPVLRSVQGSGPSADMKSRLADWSISQGKDTVGTGHYRAHGLHSQIRSQYGGTGNVDAIYLGCVAYVFPTPRNLMVSDVVQGPAPAVTEFYEERHANGMVIRRPLPATALLDEFGAYFWGTCAGVRANDRSSRTRSSYQFARQMLAQCRRLVVVCRQRGYSHTDELEGVVESGADVLDELGAKLGE